MPEFQTILKASSCESSPHILAPWSVMSVSHMLPWPQRLLGSAGGTIGWHHSSVIGELEFVVCKGQTFFNVLEQHCDDGYIMSIFDVYIYYILLNVFWLSNVCLDLSINIDVSCLISSMDVITLARRRTSSWDQRMDRFNGNGWTCGEQCDACSPFKKNRGLDFMIIK